MSRVCQAAALALFALACSADIASAAANRPSKEEIGRWIRQLGDNDFDVREAASRNLWAAGRPAEAALHRARQSTDLEVARRAKEILDNLNYGLYPDTPKEVIDLVKAYRSERFDGDIVDMLVALGFPGYRTAMKIAVTKEKANDRGRADESKRRLRNLMAKVTQTCAVLLADGEFDRVEELLEAGLVTETDVAFKHYTEFLHMRGLLDERISFFQDEATDPAAAVARAVLPYLYRARGDLANAQAAAETAGNRELLELILADQQDWRELARKPIAGLTTKPWERLEDLAPKAAYLRLSGDDVARERILKEINSSADPGADPWQEPQPWRVGSALVLNDRMSEASALLDRYKVHVIHFELLCAQLKFREAFALADKAMDAKDPAVFWLELGRARALAQLGERRQAASVLAKLFDARIAPGERYYHVIATEYQIGLKDQAYDHCVKIFARAEEEDSFREFINNPDYYSRKVLPFEYYGTAEKWWHFFRSQHPNEKLGATLGRLKDLADARIRGEPFTALIREAEEAMAKTSSHRRDEMLEALVEVSLTGGRDDLAKALCEKSEAVTDSAAPFVRMGDYLASKKKWEQAAEYYGKAWRKEPTDAWLLYLRGWSLVQSGREKEGGQIMDRAAWIPLGDETYRNEFAENLLRLGQGEASLRERDRAIRIDTLTDFEQTGDALEEVARAALVEDDSSGQARFGASAVAHSCSPHGLAPLHACSALLAGRSGLLKAAVCYERERLLYLEWNHGMAKTGKYLLLAHQVHHQQARILLASGRVRDSLREIEACRALLPCNVNLAVDLVPELQRSGNKEQADTLFAKVWADLSQVSKDYPKCAMLHHDLAWLAARCKRNLGAGLEHAERAADLDPKNATYLDTLAEVLFQRGDKGNAVANSKKASDIDPQTDYFARQRTRIEAGNPEAPMPTSMLTTRKSQGVFLLPRELFNNNGSLTLMGKSILKYRRRGSGLSGR
jgi:tetratricopeptide (TPR) repeat protein